MLIREKKIDQKIYAVWEHRSPVRFYEVTVQNLEKSSLLNVVLYTYSKQKAVRKYIELIGG